MLVQASVLPVGYLANPHGRTRVVVVLVKLHGGGLGVQRTTVQEGKGMAEGEVAAALGVKSTDGTTGNGGLDGGGGGWCRP